MCNSVRVSQKSLSIALDSHFTFQSIMPPRSPLRILPVETPLTMIVSPTYRSTSQPMMRFRPTVKFQSKCTPKSLSIALGQNSFIFTLRATTMGSQMRNLPVENSTLTDESISPHTIVRRSQLHDALRGSPTWCNFSPSVLRNH
ncbi:hypothetical protein JTE90_002996 [Oedothorax gibbosus]|uniref:Uncharacterized protein n=1 Tax=Oedothorax gibbosus TaxID=931172 RepID=A0AAV6VG14_9ARAC|nr:hypothetical protein JTE90_002996 [Oedothorax gibbosus]